MDAAEFARLEDTFLRFHGEFEADKSDVALDEYEVRRWPGWRHHITMCWRASAFLLTLQQDWGGRCP